MNNREIIFVSNKGHKREKQSHLGWVAPEFIPQLAVASYPVPENKFSSQRIVGPTWEKLLADVSIPFSDHIKITQEALRQNKYLFEQFGVVLGDRHEGNMKLQMSPDGPLGIKGKRWKLWQLDVEEIYDVCRDRLQFSKEATLARRPGRIKIKNEAETRIAVDRCCAHVLFCLTRARTPRPIYQEIVSFIGSRHNRVSFADTEKFLEHIKESMVS